MLKFHDQIRSQPLPIDPEHCIIIELQCISKETSLYKSNLCNVYHIKLIILKFFITFQEFVDLVGPKTFEDSAVPVEGTENILENPSLKVSSTQMTQICQVHQKLYKHLVNTDWYQPIRADSLQLHDWIRPILSSYTSASVLIKHLTDVLSKSY